MHKKNSKEHEVLQEFGNYEPLLKKKYVDMHEYLILDLQYRLQMIRRIITLEDNLRIIRINNKKSNSQREHILQTNNSFHNQNSEISDIIKARKILYSDD